MKTPSQCSRVLAVLEDGRSHTISEIHERAGTMRLNSRVAELRTHGHEIICSRDGETYSYQLLSLREPDPTDADSRSPLGGVLDSAGTEPSGSRSESNEGSGGPMRRVPTPADAGSPVQLAFEVAA